MVAPTRRRSQTRKSKKTEEQKPRALVFAVEPVPLPQFERLLRKTSEAPETGGYAVHAYYGSFTYDWETLKALSNLVHTRLNTDITIKSVRGYDLVVINNGK